MAFLLRPAEVNGNISRFNKLRRAGKIPPANSTSSELRSRIAVIPWSATTHLWSKCS